MCMCVCVCARARARMFDLYKCSLVTVYELYKALRAPERWDAIQIFKIVVVIIIENI